MGSGGARVGAGRPKGSKKLPRYIRAEKLVGNQENPVTPIDLLMATINDGSLDLQTRIRAAIAAAPFVHERRSALGKKEVRQESAKTASEGKYAPAVAPKLAVVK